MTTIICAAHDMSAPGMKNSVEMVIGLQDNFHQVMLSQEDGIPVNKGQSITPEEIPAFEHLAQIGFSIEFHLLPDTAAVSWEAAAKKLAG